MTHGQASTPRLLRIPQLQFQVSKQRLRGMCSRAAFGCLELTLTLLQASEEMGDTLLDPLPAAGTTPVSDGYHGDVPLAGLCVGHDSATGGPWGPQMAG